MVDIATQPFKLRWGRLGMMHFPDFLTRRSDGSQLIIDVRPRRRIKARDAELFAVTVHGPPPWRWNTGSLLTSRRFRDTGLRRREVEILSSSKIVADVCRRAPTSGHSLALAAYDARSMLTGSDEGGCMRDIVVGDRTISVRHVGIEPLGDGEIHRCQASISGSEATTGIAILRAGVAVDARVLRSVIENGFLWDYEGTRQHGLLTDPDTRAWRDRNCTLLQRAVRDLESEILELPDEPVSDVERTLMRVWNERC